METTVPTSPPEREPDPIADMTAAEAAELRGLFAGNAVVDHAEAALRSFGVEDGQPERTVTVEVLTPALLAEEEQRRRVEAREQGVSFEPIPANAKVAIVARVGGHLGGVWDTDADWMCTRADLLVAMLRSASDLAADGEAELLMPTPDVLAALDGRPDATYWTAPMGLRADQLRRGMLVDDFTFVGRRELVREVTDCDADDCVWGDSCTVVVVDGSEAVHFADWNPFVARIPCGGSL